MRVVSASLWLWRHRAYRAILWGGLIAGVLDITYACVASALRGGRSPVGVLQSVASGLLGASAFDGGYGTAVLGLALHFLIAFGAATVYYVASRRLRFLVRQPVVWGILYGVAVYLFMNFVVLPLSAIPFKVSFPLKTLIPSLLVHMLFIGLPIALAVRRFAK